MNIKTLQIIENELVNDKVLAESNIEYYLMDKNLSPNDKKEKIIGELDKLKEASLRLSFWSDFISKNVIIPEEENNNTDKNN